MATTNVFNRGRLHVCQKMCDTCIYRKDSPVEKSRQQQMERDALKNEGVIPCHHTIYGQREQEAVCRGYYEAALRKGHPLLQLADRVNLVEFI